MKKEYVAPEMQSLKYVLDAPIAAEDDPWGDPTIDASALLPPLP